MAAAKPAARIDESLAHVAGARDIIGELVRDAATRPSSDLETQRLARRLRRETTQASSLLVDLLFDARPEESPLILALLASLPDRATQERVERLLERGNLPPDLRARLEQARVQLSDNLAPSPRAYPADGMKGPDLWYHVAGKDWMRHDAAELGFLWLDHLYPLTQPERQNALMAAATDLARADGRSMELLVPILEIEAHWGGKTMARWVVKFLSGWGGRDAAELLGRLAHHRDDAIRRAAAAGLASRAEAAIVPVAGRGAGKLHWCFISGFGADGRAAPAPTALRGQGNLLLSRAEESGLIRYSLLMIDLDERGVVECWGDLGFTPEDFERLLQTFNKFEEDGRFQRIPGPLALLLANGAAALSLRRDYVLPKEYFLWRSIFTGEGYDARQYRVRIGGGSNALDPWGELVHVSPPDDATKPW